jgi:DNA-directed RNA polymerase specialized sigma subunit
VIEISKIDVENLRALQNLKRQLAMIQSSIQSLRDAATNTTVALAERVQTSPGNKIENLVVKLVDMQNEYEEKRRLLISTHKELKRKIDKLSGIAQVVLTEHYMNGLPWDEVAYVNGYTQRHIYRKRKSALKELEAM